VSYADQRIERDGALAIEYQPGAKHGPIVEVSTIATGRRTAPGVVFGQVRIVDGKRIEYVELERPPTGLSDRQGKILAPPQVLPPWVDCGPPQRVDQLLEVPR
jgi:hypothetical protein